MDTVVVRYRPGEGRADENQSLVEAVFAELNEAKPEGLQYITFRLDDGTFVHVARTSGENPLSESEAFAQFQANLGDRCADGEGPNPQPAVVVGSYGWHLD